jgi:hypothetical protein
LKSLKSKMIRVVGAICGHALERRIEAAPVEEARERVALRHPPLALLSAQQALLQELERDRLADHGDREHHNPRGERVGHGLGPAWRRRR